MPSNPRRRSRALAIALLGFQALLWGGGSIAEAKSAAESLTRYTHVEDQSTTACPPIHSHLDCLVCRTLNGGASGGTATALVPAVSGVSAQPVSAELEMADAILFGTLGSRGPPLT
jgi:hypothetical protein